jgi:hypothetical protein
MDEESRVHVLVRLLPMCLQPVHGKSRYFFHLTPQYSSCNWAVGESGTERFFHILNFE